MDVVRCAECGEENPGRARFCLACGTPIASAAPAAPGREVRRTVTVLFADMAGFTALGERLDQESLRRVMDRFYDEMRGAVEGEGGTVAKFIGDAVMAVWGTPSVREDDALRAVRAAEAMRGALAALNEDLERRWDVRIVLRTGVNTGEVVVDPAKPADLLVGDTVNVAARLEQAAAPGEVLVGGETYRLVRDDARLEPVEPLVLKGKGRPVSAFRLVDGSARARREARLETPLVGRDRELARLRAALDVATAASETRVVTLVGSPGVGKTRLVREFTASLGETATVVTGRCEAAGEGLTFRPVAEVVRSGAGIHEGDVESSARHKLEAVLPEDGDRDRVTAVALGLIGLGPAVSVEESFWAFRRFLEGLARLRRLVVLLDDVHWGQPTFLDLIEHLAAWGRGAPVLVLVLARPELREVRPSLTERNEAIAEVIGLGPLAPADSRALVERLLGEADLPPSLAERVLETTEGNPLFLGEMLRMLVDDGVLRRSGDQWVTQEGPGVAVPPTIHALLAARIARLSEGERSVVERAAVIGQQFSAGAVAALGPPDAGGGLAEHLDLLRRKELVAPEGTLWQGEESFRFQHVLIRDAAYRSLLKEARAELHERFACWLEDRTGEHEELIALHLERAHVLRRELGPLDEPGRDLAGRAALRLHSAGRAALLREDLPAAANLLLRALDPLDAADPARLPVLADLAETQLSAGDTAAAEGTVEELALRAEAAGDEPMRALATALACQLALLTGAGHLRDTIALAGEAAAVLERAGHRAGEAKAHHVTAQAHSQLGEIAAAEQALDRALVASRAARDRRRGTAVLSGAPRAALWGPSPIVRASGRCLDVVRILRMTPGNRHLEAAALRCQAVLEAMRGRPEASREIVATCRETLEELGLTLELHELATYAGIVELLAGEPAAAEAQLRDARDGFAALGVDSGAAQAAALLARALVEQGRFHAAEGHTREAERHGGEDLKTGIVWRGVRAEALARRGERAEAERLAREAVALAEPTDALADKADALMALATVLRACGRADEGREAARRAHDLYVAKEHTVGAMRARVALGGRAAAGRGALGRAAAALGDRPVERMWKAYCEAFNARDWERLGTLVAHDVSLRDHRTVGWEEVRGAQAFLDAQRSGAAIAADTALHVARLVDADDAHAAVILAAHAAGHDGAGAVEIAVGVVTRIDAEGRVDRVELFGAGDEAAMRERLAALRTPSVRRRLDDGTVAVAVAPSEGGAVVVSAMRDGTPEREETFDAGAEPDALRRFDELCREAFGDVVLSAHAVEPIAPAVVARQVRWAGAFNAHDWDALVDMWDEHLERVDHRNVGWEEIEHRDRFAQDVHAFAAATDDPRARVELLAGSVHGDAFVLAAHITFGGTSRDTGGTTLNRMGWVIAGTGDRSTHHEIFDDDDVEGLLGRYAELSEAARALPVSERARARTEMWVRRASEGRYDEMAETEDYVLVDHRMGGAATAGQSSSSALRSLGGTVSDAQFAAEMLAGWDDGTTDVAAARVTVTGSSLDSGGRFELTYDSVSAARDDVTYRVEMFEPGDPAVLERFEALRAEAASRGGQVSHGWIQALDARDWVAARALLADDFALVDRRPVGWATTRGADEVIEATRDFTETLPYGRWSARLIEEVEVDGRIAESVMVTFGSTAGDAPWEVSFGSVGSIVDGLRTRFDIFEPEDEEGMRAAFADLVADLRR